MELPDAVVLCSPLCMSEHEPLPRAAADPLLSPATHIFTHYRVADSAGLNLPPLNFFLLCLTH